MKQILFSKSILMGAALLAGTAMFTACSSDEVVQEEVNLNPTFDGESVKTQFAISIPAAGPKTKMTSGNTQQDGSFLGMQNIRLIPYNNNAWETAQTLDKILALDNITTTPNNNETQKIYTDVDIPVGTDRFLFYGVAIGDDPVQNGSLIPTIDGQGNRSDIKFELDKIHDGITPMPEQTRLVGLLNRVENTTDWSTYNVTTNPTAEDRTITNLYTQFKDMKAGSATSILNLMQSLYRSLSFASNDGDASGAAKMAYAIRQAITTDANGGLVLTASGTSGNETLEYPGDFDSTFPANYDLPDGAVRVKFDNGGISGEKFSADNNSYEIGGSNQLKIENITYPASLYYFCQSELVASATATAAFPQNGSWGAETSWNGWEQSKVEATTRSIAMKSPVNYGVGMLETTVKCASSNLLDKGDNTIAIGTGFTLTGVLVGGQPDEVQWNMYQLHASSLTRNYTIYDAATNNPTVNAAASSTSNYTLVLDNSKFTSDAYEIANRADKAGQEAVNIAIELTNNTGQNFEGVDGIIYAGSKFYLVANLNPNSTTAGEVTGTTGSFQGKESVFMKDYRTKATLTISSLKNAYNCIPDLRSTSLQFGLAVNLQWETGLAFNVTIE